jgi:flagellar basal-body rod protein FlgG
VAVGDDSGFQVLEDGRIIRDANNPAANAERLFLGYTEQPERLVKEGNGLLRWVGDGEQLQSVRNVAFLNNPAINPNGYPFHVLQGHVEGSNVDVTQTMTEMMSMFRLYEANQKVLQAYDRSIEKTVNEVGRVF